MGALGFAAQESVLMTLGRRKLLPVHLLRGPEVREGPPDVRTLLAPRNAEPGTGALSWVTPYRGEVG